MSTAPAGSGPTETDMRDVMLGVIDVVPTDYQLRATWTKPCLVSLARE